MSYNILIVDENGNISVKNVAAPLASPVLISPPGTSIICVDIYGNVSTNTPETIYTNQTLNLLTVDVNTNTFSTISSSVYNPCANLNGGTPQTNGTCVCKNGWAGSRCDKFCDAGKIHNASGGCDSCPAGQTSNAARTACVKCDAGSESVAGGVCTLCPPGKYNDVAGEKCKNCPYACNTISRGTLFSTHDSDPADCHVDYRADGYIWGKVSTSPGATKCVECDGGKRNMRGNACEKCYVGDGYGALPGLYYGFNGCGRLSALKS